MAVWSETSVYEISNTKRIDSEYYHPEYIEAETIVLQHNVQKLKFLGQFLIGPFGSAFHVSNYDPDSPYRYVRGKDVKPFQLLDDDNVYMPPDDFERLKKYALKTDDLLISVVGTLGNVSIVPENLEGIFSCKSTVFRNSYVDPYFLLAYFNCKYGRKCLLRRQRGAVQTGLNKDDLEQIPVPIFNERIYSELGEKVRKALEKRDISKSLYTKAQELLEKELGLNRLVIEKSKSYETSFSEVVNGGRIDGEHYQYQYKQNKELIRNYKNGFTYLLTLVDVLPPNIDPHKTPNIEYQYVELSNINPSIGIIDGSKVILGRDTPSRARRQVQNGDIIASSVVGSLDKAGIVDDTKDQALASTGFFHLRTKEFPPEFLLILIRSTIIKMQLQQEATGGILSAVPEKNLKNVIVPNLPNDLIHKIAHLVKESHQAKKESEQLLAQAKKQVEDLIEGAVR